MALQMLVEDGKIAAKDVTAALKRREKIIRELRARRQARQRGTERVAEAGQITRHAHLRRIATTPLRPGR